jgi:hypothetical protein
MNKYRIYFIDNTWLDIRSYHTLSFLIRAMDEKMYFPTFTNKKIGIYVNGSNIKYIEIMETLENN